MGLEKAVEDGSGVWAPDIYVGDLNGVPSSWLWLDLVLDILAS